jgi:hypothetical protein
MNKKLFLGIIAFLAISTSFQSCTKDTCTREMTYTKYTPIFMSRADMRQDAVSEGSRTLENPGKIYFYNNFIFINELREGIHIVDNTDPQSPQNVGFIAIKGNVDMAVKDNILYADNFMDLLAIDISNPLSVRQLGREQDVFPILGEDLSGNVLAYYETEVVTEIVDCSSWRGGMWFLEGDALGNIPTSGASPIAPKGVGGSMARFTVRDNYLYTIDQSTLHVFDISNGATPTEVNTVSVGWNIETIFPHEDKLFIGSQNGMFIYDISTATSPVFLSEFSHAGACDPVYVDGNLAYVTLRSGTICQGFTNQLEVIDISNLTNPTLLKTYPMENPHGLSIRDKHLYLCEGEFGLKVFDINDPMAINQVESVDDLNTYDVISLENNVLLVIGSDGFYQYDSSDPSDLKLLSKIEVTN